MNIVNTKKEQWFLDKIKQANKKHQYFDILKNVSLVMPTYARQDFILRQILYWYNSGVSIIILDGSVKSLPKNILDVIVTLDGIQYIHSLTSFSERINMAIGYINTPYVASLCDDEFYLKGALRNLILELDSDIELSGCIGQTVGFKYDNEAKILKYRDSYDLWGYSAMQDDIKERTAIAIKSYVAATAYGLLRKEVWQKGWGESKKYSSAYTTEMHQAMTTYLLGKFKSTDELFWLRSDENEPIHDDNWDRELDFIEWWLSEKYIDEKNEFIYDLSDIAQKQLKVNRDEAKEIVISTFNLMIDGKKISLKSVMSKILKIFLSKSAFRKLKVFIRKTKPIPVLKDIKYPFLQNVFSNNIEENQRDIEAIESLVKEFHLLK